MKFLLLLFFSFAFLGSIAQKQHFIIHDLSLPVELTSADNQFSGLYIDNEKLFMLSESRLQEKAEGKLYAIELSDLDRKLKDSSYVLPFRKYHICNLDVLVNKINAAGQNYEGLEAIIIDSGRLLLSVETDTPSPNCYMLRGQLNDMSVMLDTSFMVQMNKPVAAGGEHIYNAGFEAVVKKDGKVYAFFEFNYFPSENYVYQYDDLFSHNNATMDKFPVAKLPFRITDITNIGKDHFTAINYFYNGDGGDTIYRTPVNHRRSSKLIKSKKGYKDFCRLIDIELKPSGFTWKPVWVFPAKYTGFNWEGIAAYNNGYFIINDKYTLKKPYKTTLLYLQKKAPGRGPER